MGNGGRVRDGQGRNMLRGALVAWTCIVVGTPFALAWRAVARLFRQQRRASAWRAAGAVPLTLPQARSLS